jgi:hypothetical protein
MNGKRQDINRVDQTMLNFNLQHNFTDQQQLNLDMDYFYLYGNQPQGYTFDYFTNSALTGHEEIKLAKKTRWIFG